MSTRAVTRFLVLVAAVGGAVLPAEAGVVINVDKTAQVMSVSLDGQPLHRWKISSGRRGYATPAGSFTPFRLEEDHFSKEWDDAPMPHAIFFTRQGHAIHGSFEMRRLGSPASHGCVRLSPAHARTLFELVRTQGLGNTKVVVSGEEPAAVTARAAPRPARRRDTSVATAAELPRQVDAQSEWATRAPGVVNPYWGPQQFLRP